MPPILKPLNRQILVITGASSGIGLATARKAAAAGARVFLAARAGEALSAICAEIESAGGKAAYLALDVASEDAMEALAQAALARFGGIDTWVNAAGVGLVGELKDTATDDHRRLFETNYWGVVYGSLAAARYFRSQGTAGAIINMGSAASDIALPFMGAYAASKFAVKGFTTSLRMELRHERLPVSVTLIKPGSVDSPLANHAKTMLGAATAMPPPRYQPVVVARAILNAAVIPRREIAVGADALFGGAVARMAPSLMEALLSQVGRAAVVDEARPPPLIDNLHTVPAEGQERSGRYYARPFSLTTMAQTHPAQSALAALGAAALYAVMSKPKRPKRPAKR
ncbi:MAG: SDR-family protein [Rubritepida sp.]|nr:SDR-family protein [Rubritepida sp.]